MKPASLVRVVTYQLPYFADASQQHGLKGQIPIYDLRMSKMKSTVPNAASRSWPSGELN